MTDREPAAPTAGDAPDAVRLGFWQEPDVVAMFASRDPDHRLLRLAASFAHPPRVRVLDLGCAGGRNTVFLASRGFDVLASDFSPAMVEETGRRLAAVVGTEEAARRVRVAPMDRLGWIEDATVDLVVALGIYHNAGTVPEWERAVAESVRVLARGGRLLTACFTPDTDPGGGLIPVAGEPHVFEGFDSGRSVLFHAAELDARFSGFGLAPWTPSATVSRDTEKGRRVTANGLYRKR